MIYQIFQRNDLMNIFHIPMQVLYNFSREMAAGYFNENKYHNAMHICDTMQAMHYFIERGDLKS